MADFTVTISKSNLNAQIARRTTLAVNNDTFYAEKSVPEKMMHQLHGEGDRITGDFINEAAKDVLGLFLSRQGDVLGDPFDNGSTNIVYRAALGTPTLEHQDAIIDRLTGNVQDAIIYGVLVNVYKTDGNTAKLTEYLAKLADVSDSITADLHRLHD